MSDFKCLVCDTTTPCFSWTDTHGIAQCDCGTPYRLYHYEGEGDNMKRVEKPPECCSRPEWIPWLRRFRENTKRIIPSGYSFHPNYERASESDRIAFNNFCKRHKKELPKPVEYAAA